MARGGHSSAGQPCGAPRRQEAGGGGEDPSEKIQVVVRVRPESASEQEASCSRMVVKVVGEQMIVFDPCETASPEYFHGRARRQRDINKRANKDARFVFDRVFGQDSVTEQLFESTTKRILDGLLEGYNCSVFAYGATGAGKTHTMLGSPERPGVIFLTMMDLYQRIEDIKDVKTCSIAVSYLEVYNEQIRDLLMPSGFLPVRENPQRGVTVTGLTLHKPHTAQELMHMLRIGNGNRTQHPTDANAESSRSHAVFQVFVRQRDRTASTSADWHVAKMSLIDLAGSERATATKNRDARFREGANINRSLLALGNCINALAEGKSKGFVPYRNSKLTRLLKDSLGGNCRTVMIAAVSPSSLSYEDTYNTLRYADRAKNIKVGLKKNVVSVDLHVSQYVQVIEDLRSEVAELKSKLKLAEEQGVMGTATNVPEIAGVATFQRLKVSLDGVFRERVEIRKELLELESLDRDLSYKICRKKMALARIAIVVNGKLDGEKTKCLTRAIEGAQKRKVNVEKRRLSLQSRMSDNISWLQQVETEVMKSKDTNPKAELLDEIIQAQHLKVELRDMRRQTKYLKKLCRMQEREVQTSDKFNLLLLQTVYNQYMVIKGHNIASYKEIAEFEAVQQMAHKDVETSVAWADQGQAGGEAAPAPPVTPRLPPGYTVGDFSIGNLLEFPILTCAPMTPGPRTPHHGSAFTPFPGGNNPQQTPASGKRGRNRTPRNRQARQARTPGGTAAKDACQQDSHAKPGRVSDDLTGLASSNDTFVLNAVDRSTVKGSCTADDGATVSSAGPAVRLFTKPLNDSPVETPPQTGFSGVEGVFPLQPSPLGSDATVSRVAAPVVPACEISPSRLPPARNAAQLNVDLFSAQELISQIVVQQEQQQHCHQQGSPDTIGSSAVVSRPLATINEAYGTKQAAAYLPSVTGGGSDQTVVLNKAVGMKPFSANNLPLPVVASPCPQPDEDLKTCDLNVTHVIRCDVPSLPATPVFSLDSSNLNNTVTKVVPLSSDGSVTVTKTKPEASEGANRKQFVAPGTVTKPRSELENTTITPPTITPSVVKSVDFKPQASTSPPGPMSFADALKSPAPAAFKQLQKEVPQRSPLARRDNLPTGSIPCLNSRRLTFATDSKSHHLLKDKASRGRQALPRPLADNGAGARRLTLVHQRRVTQATETLQQLGLPSVLTGTSGSAQGKQMAGGGSDVYGNAPGYMRSTKASSRRRKNHRRSITYDSSSSSSGSAHRVQDENIPPAMRRDLSSSSHGSSHSSGLVQRNLAPNENAGSHTKKTFGSMYRNKSATGAAFRKGII